jgi:hypothetical protein
MFYVKFFLTFITLSILVACGGGGSGGGGGTTQTPNLTITGTTATGAALAGATIVVVDAAGISEECASKSSDNGTYSCPLYKVKTAPFLMQASSGSLKVHAVVPATATTQTINITPISELMAQKYASSASVSASEMIARPEEASKITGAAEKASTAIDVVKTVVAEIMKVTGNAATNDPLTGNLQAGNSNDKLDQLLSTMKFAASAAEFKVYIPASDGVVTVTVAYNTTKETAKSDTGTRVASKTVDMTQGQSFEAAVRNLVAKISSGTAAEIVSAVGFEYDQGYTPTRWADRVINKWRPSLGTLTVKSIEKIGIEPITKTWLTKIVIESSLGGATELVIGMKDVSTNSTPSWKMAGDELTVNMGLEIRHELEALSSARDADPGTVTFRFSRRLNTWVDKSDYVSSVSPSVLEIYILKLEEKFDATRVPDFTLYKPADSSSCNAYTTSKNVCSDILVDEGTALYERMSANQTKFIIKATNTTGGTCLNCTADGTPKTIVPAGKAMSVKSVFGPTAIEATLKAGVKDLGLDAEKYARTYFAAPSKEEISKLFNYLYATTPSNDLPVSWIRPTIASNNQIDGMWGWVSTCSGIGSELYSNGDNTTWARKENNYLIKDVGTRIKNANYVSLSFNSKISEGTFQFNIITRKNCF